MGGEKKIAILGAGMAGLAAAFRLSGEGVKTHLFEKSRGLSGRAASRTKNGCRYDYGANYLTVPSNEVASLLFESLPTEGLCRISGEIGTFDESGKVSVGEPAQSSSARWTYREGISELGKRIADTAGLTVTRECFIARIERSGGKWTLIDANGERHGDFDAVLLTQPAPQVIDLLTMSHLEDPDCAPVIDSLSCAGYQSQFSVVLHFPGGIPFPEGMYAMINSDRRHEIVWISDESRKPGRVPDGESLLIVQMSPSWTRDHYDLSREEVGEMTFAATARLLGGEMSAPDWIDLQRWRYALPVSRAGGDALEVAGNSGLFFAGDSYVEKGRVSSAIESGFSAARRIRSAL
jgi:renalase